MSTCRMETEAMAIVVVLASCPVADSTKVADHIRDHINEQVHAASWICRYVKLIRSPTISFVFGISCFQNCCMVPAMMMSVPWPTGNVLVSFVLLCLMRKFRV